MKLEGRGRRTYLSSLSLSPFREVVLPGNPFPVPIESAGRILGQHRTEDDRPRADLARHHDDAADIRDEGKERIRDVPRSEVIRLNRPNRLSSIGAPGSDARVVHEHVEARGEAGEILGEGRDAPAVCYVELVVEDV